MTGKLLTGTGKAALSPSQVHILQAMRPKRGDDDPPELTRAEVERKAGVGAGIDVLGPAYRETVEKHPDSLVGRGLVQSTYDIDESKVRYYLTARGLKYSTEFVTRKTGVEEDDRIPRRVLVAAVRPVKATRTYGIENYTEADLKEIRDALPEQYRHVGLEVIRQQAWNARKQGAFKEEFKFPEWYEEYREGEHWSKLEAQLTSECAVNPEHDADTVGLFHRLLVRGSGEVVLLDEKKYEVIALCDKCWNRCRKFMVAIPADMPGYGG